MRVNLAEALIGLSTEHRELAYNWRDVSLYALSVGAKADDLMYTYEKNRTCSTTRRPDHTQHRSASSYGA